MSEAVIRAIEALRTTNLFDPDVRLPDSDITELVRLGTLAPTSFNFQNWRFIAVRTPEAQARLRKISWDQAKITESAVTFIVVGHAPDFVVLSDRLAPAVAEGFFPAHMVPAWQSAAKASTTNSHNVAGTSRSHGDLRRNDPDSRSAGQGLGTAPIIGFDADAVAREFDLRDGEIPVLLLAVGRALPSNWPRKPRRPVAEVLELV